jgi:hypothetical protein
VRLEGLGKGKFKNPVTSLGMERATYRLVAYCLNQLSYRVPPTNFFNTIKEKIAFGHTVHVRIPRRSQNKSQNFCKEHQPIILCMKAKEQSVITVEGNSSCLF